MRHNSAYGIMGHFMAKDVGVGDEVAMNGSRQSIVSLTSLTNVGVLCRIVEEWKWIAGQHRKSRFPVREILLP
jgi:hypothetical protein